MIRVGTIKYVNGRPTCPKFENFESILCLTPSYSEYGKLGPYALKNEKGQLLENVWQFSKIYPHLPRVSIPLSARNQEIVWQWQQDEHYKDGHVLKEPYLKWRRAGMDNKKPVRNPVGWKLMSSCVGSFKDESLDKKLDYIEARKEIYLPMYSAAVRKHELFSRLLAKLKSGRNLLICEVDGPRQESLGYYKKEYNVPDNWIENNSIAVTPETMSILLNDKYYAFGHGYCLAMTLLEELKTDNRDK